MPVKNRIEDLRNRLFATLEALRDDEKPMALDRAKAIADVARAVIESAKVEVEFLNVTGAARSTGFLPAEDGAMPVSGARGAARRGLLS